MGDFREALEAVLARPVTDAELSRAHRLGHPAGCLLRRAHGPVWSVPAKVATAIKRRVRICL